MTLNIRDKATTNDVFLFPSTNFNPISTTFRLKKISLYIETLGYKIGNEKEDLLLSNSSCCQHPSSSFPSSFNIVTPYV